MGAVDREAQQLCLEEVLTLDSFSHAAWVRKTFQPLQKWGTYVSRRGRNKFCTCYFPIIFVASLPIFHNRFITFELFKKSLTCVSREAVTSVDPQQVPAGGVVLTGVTVTLVHLHLTVGTGPHRETSTDIACDTVYTPPAILTWGAHTVIDVSLAVYPRISVE